MSSAPPPDKRLQRVTVVQHDQGFLKSTVRIADDVG